MNPYWDVSHIDKNRRPFDKILVLKSKEQCESSENAKCRRQREECSRIVDSAEINYQLIRINVNIPPSGSLPREEEDVSLLSMPITAVVEEEEFEKDSANLRIRSWIERQTLLAGTEK